MTATLATPATTSVDVPPATRFRRRALGAAGVVGGLLTVGGFVATVWEGSSDKLAYLDSLVVDPFRSQVAAVLLHFGYFALVPVVFALAVMTRRRARVAGNIGFGLAIGGSLALPGLLVTDFYDMAIRQNLPADQAVAVSDAAQALPLGFLVGGPFIMGTFVGMTVLGLAAWRAGFFHWLPTLLVPAAVAIPFVIPVGTVQGIAQGLALGGFLIAVGIAVLRVTDEEWISGIRGAGR
jgi:hypothetical protein